MRSVPPVAVLKILVRNKEQAGLPAASIVTLIRQRLGWERLDPSTMDEYNRNRYEAAAVYLKELEDASSN